MLVHLFERNLVDSLNLFDRFEKSDEFAHECLGNSIIIVWEYFSSHHWLASKHKIDFIIDYLNRLQLQQHLGESTVKLKYSFDEFDTYVQEIGDYPDSKNMIINNFKTLPDLQKEILQLSHFEKWDAERISDHIGRDEDFVDVRRLKAWRTWINLLVQNLKLTLEKDYLLEQTDGFIRYELGQLSKEKMLQFELQLSSNAVHKRAFEQFQSLVDYIRAYRRETLRKYLNMNSSTRLTGNIWGNKVTWASAIFIAIIGILIWYTDHHNLGKQNDLPETSPIDSLQNQEP